MQEEIKQKKNQTLGRGLSALLGEAMEEEMTLLPENKNFSIDIHLIRPGRYQPRQSFNEENLDSLIASVREKGIIQPLVVRPLKDKEDGFYEIIAGERRWRAAKTLNHQKIPVIIRRCSDKEALEIAIIENIQRDDLNPLEEAEAYQRLLEEFHYTQEQLGKSIGKSRSHVTNTLRLNSLPAHVKKLILEEKITAGHARALMTSDHADQLLEKIVNENLSVRDTEKLAKNTKLKIDPSEFDIQTQELEREIKDILNINTKLKISKNGGILSLHFHSYEEMDDLMDKIRLLK